MTLIEITVVVKGDNEGAKHSIANNGQLMNPPAPHSGQFTLNGLISTSTSKI
jgi:hypothetical protein